MEDQTLISTPTAAPAKSPFWGLILIAMFACLLGVSVGLAMLLDWVMS